MTDGAGTYSPMDENGWLPIETAPKDGGEFLAFDHRVKKFDVCTMKLFNDEWLPIPTQFDGEHGPFEDEFGHDSDDVTHWQPLPNPPVLKEQGE